MATSYYTVEDHGVVKLVAMSGHQFIGTRLRDHPEICSTARVLTAVQARKQFGRARVDTIKGLVDQPIEEQLQFQDRGNRSAP